MELLLTTEDLEPLPEPCVFVDHVKPEGILNSSYKTIVKANFKNTSSESIFGIRQRLKSAQYQFTSSIETVLKVSLFATIIMIIFS
ncbi:hypothetical protein [Changchengzhania lutea]|uniref:hypothetical protein n=1 Tax=Changchengzhania lutea TaxID=2049305 RepID=UPI00115CF169|nr:hypothetical protein [Changchengzhania lutea]